MKINIQAPWEVNDYLDTVINEKVGKLSSFGHEILHADVFLKNGSGVGIEDKLVEIRLRLRGPEFFAHASADTLEKAVTAACEKLKKQLIKKKEILKERR